MHEPNHLDIEEGFFIVEVWTVGGDLADDRQYLANRDCLNEYIENWGRDNGFEDFTFDIFECHGVKRDYNLLPPTAARLVLI